MEWTYQFLQAQITDWLGRTDLSAQLPIFIDLAERRMNLELRLRCMERRSTHQTKANESALPLPGRRTPGDWDVYLNMREVLLAEEGRGGAYTPSANLNFVNPDRFSSLRGGSGRPESYTIVGTDLLFSPVPDGEYTVYLDYYAEIPPLGPRQPINDLLTSHPMLYLYAALVESVPYTRGSGPAELWIRYYESAKSAAQYADDKARFTRQIEARSPRRID